MEEYYVCDICGEQMQVPVSQVSFKRIRYIFNKQDPATKAVRSYDLCKDCYDTLNGCIRNMIIKSKKTRSGIKV